MFKVYVDGQEGTTGLQINERLEKHSNIEILKIDPEKRKDPSERQRILNEADVAFLCLPDAASKEAAEMTTNPKTRLIDASTAFRTDPDWVYGLPEMCKGQREKIRNAKRVSNPGCYPTGFVLLVRPLVENGIIGKDYPLTCHAVSGYSGGGKKLIATYEAPGAPHNHLMSRPYAFGLKHKHAPEMKIHGLLDKSPIFSPSVGNYYKGMLVMVPLLPYLCKVKNVTPEYLGELYNNYYAGERFVKVMQVNDETLLDGGFLDPQGVNGTNLNQVFVYGHEDQIMLVSRLDNLGKGASGAAVQNMNLMLGFDEGLGLE
jgi:N-acetyl-gamma-glutamyl-phosphate reductase